MTKTKAQWITVAIALTAAIASQLPLLQTLVPESAATVVLVITNILSAVLPSLRQEAQGG